MAILYSSLASIECMFNDCKLNKYVFYIIYRFYMNFIETIYKRYDEDDELGGIWEDGVRTHADVWGRSGAPESKVQMSSDTKDIFNHHPTSVVIHPEPVAGINLTRPSGYINMDEERRQEKLGEIEKKFYNLFRKYVLITWNQNHNIQTQLQEIYTNKLYNDDRKLQQLILFINYWIQHQSILLFEPIFINPQHMIHPIETIPLRLPKYNLINKKENQKAYILALAKDILENHVTTF